MCFNLFNDSWCLNLIPFSIVSEMALLPYLLEELNRPTIYDQNFGLGLFNDDFPSAVGSLRPYYLRPWRLFPHDESGISSVQHDKDGFKVKYLSLMQCLFTDLAESEMFGGIRVLIVKIWLSADAQLHPVLFVNEDILDLFLLNIYYLILFCTC